MRRREARARSSFFGVDSSSTFSLGGGLRRVFRYDPRFRGRRRLRPALIRKDDFFLRRARARIKAFVVLVVVRAEGDAKGFSRGRDLR